MMFEDFELGLVPVDLGFGGNGNPDLNLRRAGFTGEVRGTKWRTNSSLGNFLLRVTR